TWPLSIVWSAVMKRAQCEHRQRRATTTTLKEVVSGRTFTAHAEAQQCSACGDTSIDAAALMAFHQAIAAELARTGPVSSEAFRFMRKALMMPAQEMAN